MLDKRCVFLYNKFSVQLYYIHKESKPACGTILLSVARSLTCFGQIYWPSSRSHMQRCFQLELSHVVITVVMFTVIKL